MEGRKEEGGKKAEKEGGGSKEGKKAGRLLRTASFCVSLVWGPLVGLRHTCSSVHPCAGIHLSESLTPSLLPFPTVSLTVSLSF